MIRPLKAPTLAEALIKAERERQERLERKAREEKRARMLAYGRKVHARKRPA